ncbi:MAG: hypothetical protein ACRD27_07365 [Terracidiphilus sp.]
MVQRVVNSRWFSRAAAMRAFLLYVTDHSIMGRTERLKEQTIGAEVLGRKPNYDPADDNIVRVRAHELRGRLERYFASEGINERVVITIPRGTYVPEFVPRPLLLTEPPTTPQRSGTPEPPKATPARQYLPTSRRQRLLLAVSLLVAVVASSLLTRYALRQSGPTVAEEPIGAIHDFWGQFFDGPNEDLKVVYSDPNFALWQDLNDKTLDLGDYLNRAYLNQQDNKYFNVAIRRVASPVDLGISVRLATLAAEFGSRETPLFARDASTEFFHRGNVVLIGSHRSNPWVEVYEPSLNFQLEQDPHSGAPAFLNRSPRPGEAGEYTIPAMFDTQKMEEKAYTSYGVIAILKGCGDRGLTVLMEGLNSQATQAAGDMITDPQRLETLLTSMGHRPGTTVPPFEALIQVTSLPGGYDNPKVIAYRLRGAEPCTGN